MRSAILLLAAACTSTSTSGRSRTPGRPAPATGAGSWSVAFERSIGSLATAPVFERDGGVVSSGQRFDASGRYLGLLAIEVGGGRMIANVRALLSGGRALVEGSADGDVLLVGRADRPPEQATRRQTGSIGALAVSPDEKRVAAYDGDAIQIWSLPGLEPLERIELEGGGSAAGALAFLPDGGLVYATACRGAGCTGSGLEVRSAAGDRRRLRDGGIASVALAPAAALVEVTGPALEVIALPGGARRGRIPLPGPVTGGITEGGALAIDRDGTAAGALVCDQLLVFAARGPRWHTAYRGRIAHASGEDDCAYPSGMAFSPDGASLALVARDLTVLRAGASRAPIDIDYRPALPRGFAADDDVDGVYMPSPGTGLAPAPRVVGSWRQGGAHARVVTREAAEMSRFTDLDQWATAILTRFEPMVRDDMEPNRLASATGAVLPVRRAFVDPRGRRVLEYTILVRGGCEEMDRRVRWIEAGDALVEIDLESAPGIAPAELRGWLAAFFDAPLGGPAEKRRRIASAGYNRGPC